MDPCLITEMYLDVDTSRPAGPSLGPFLSDRANWRERTGRSTDADMSKNE